jgi:hypothetical protein
MISLKSYPFFILTVLVLFPYTYDKAQPFTSSNLPIVVINTNGQPIVDEPKINADMGIIYNGEGVRNYLTDPFNDFNGRIGIEIRGSSSQMYPKKQYSVETRDFAGEDSAVSLLGLPKEADWILYAPYSDKTLLRDVLAYRLFNDMGRYATRSRYCEVVINGNYMGVYVLLERIKRDKNRVDISKLEPSAISGDSLTGGYIIKIDKPDGIANESWSSAYPPYPGASQKIRYIYHYPKPANINSAQRNYIRGYITAFENSMNSPYYNDSINGYRKMIDVDSFVDYFLHNELTKNVDAYRISSYMHKDKDSKGGKLVMGPVWDYNIALGNGDYYRVWSATGWHIDYLTSNSSFLSNDQFQVPFWWKKLYEDPYFRNKVRARWEELKQTVFTKDKLFSYIDSLTTFFDEARIRNFQRWPILGIYVWPNYYIGQTYQDEINFLKKFIQDRLIWLDNNMIGVLSNSEVESELPAAYELYQNYPNPFNPSTIITFSIPEAAHVEIRVYDITGREAALLIDNFKEPGVYNISFSGLTLSSGVYMYTLKSGGNILSRKMILVK